jgi:DNA-binding response OmpR family regulator
MRAATAEWEAIGIPEVVRIANLEIRPAEHQLFVDGKRLPMTVREFETLFVLAQRADRVVPRGEIYRLVWGGDMAYRDRSVDVFILKIRRKLEQAAPGWAYIHTHFGIGYRFAAEPASGQEKPLRAPISR